jgi:ABC-type Mn2+/Zn2+ transport system ATPase subunit
MLATPIPIAPHPHRHSKEAEQPIALSVEGLNVAYSAGVALEDVGFTVRRGEYVAIIGPNGAGKSTLLKAILGMITPQSGSVRVESEKPLGYVPQHEGVNLQFPVTVRDVVMMGRHRQIGWLRQPRKADQAAVDIALARVGLESLGKRQIGELSGGQRRRAFIARALAQEADMLLLDEPMSGVDVDGQAAIMTVLDTLNADGLTILMTTHDLDLAFRRFGKVMALKRRLVAFGVPDEVYTPDALEQVYDRVLMTRTGGGRMTMLIDEHGCGDC